AAAAVPGPRAPQPGEPPRARAAAGAPPRLARDLDAPPDRRPQVQVRPPDDLLDVRPPVRPLAEPRVHPYARVERVRRRDPPVGDDEGHRQKVARRARPRLGGRAGGRAPPFPPGWPRDARPP